MAEALVYEKADHAAVFDGGARIESAGHEIRAAVNPAYKRATWGRRPDDVESQRAVISDMAGRRQ